MSNTNSKGVTQYTKYDPGYIILKNGDQLTGDIQLKVVNRDTVLIKLKDADGNKSKFHRKEVKKFGLGTYADYLALAKAKKKKEEEKAKKQEEFEQEREANGGIVERTTYKGVKPNEKVLNELKARNDQDETHNLHEGYALYSNGLKLIGHFALDKSAYYYVDNEDRLAKWYLSKDSQLLYIMETINGKQHKFLWGKKTGQVVAGSAPTYMFTEVYYTDQPFSYYKNLSPNAKRKGLTNLGNGAAVALSNEYAAGVVQEEGDGGLVQMGHGKNDGLFYDEWVILDNKNHLSYTVYKKNDKEVMGTLLKKCAKYSTLTEDQVKELTNVKNVDAFVQYLNSCN